jgi:exopolyphosphatase/pppGpp-phosphohydrolase
MIRRFAMKYSYDESHAAAVARLGDQLADRLAPLLRFRAEERLLLRHAAAVHDVGYYISGRRHHRHSAYLVLADDTLEEYPPSDRLRLALLARAHRKRLPRTPRAWSREETDIFAQLAAILRLADGLDYHHDGAAVIGSCLIGARAVSIEVGGVDLSGLARVLRRKASLFARVFDREVSFTAMPAGVA